MLRQYPGAQCPCLSPHRASSARAEEGGLATNPAPTEHAVLMTTPRSRQCPFQVQKCSPRGNHTAGRPDVGWMSQSVHRSAGARALRAPTASSPMQKLGRALTGLKLLQLSPKVLEAALEGLGLRMHLVHALLQGGSLLLLPRAPAPLAALCPVLGLLHLRRRDRHQRGSPQGEPDEGRRGGARTGLGGCGSHSPPWSPPAGAPAPSSAR